MTILQGILFTIVFLIGNFFTGALFLGFQEENLKNYIIRIILGLGVLAYIIFGYGLLIGTKGIFVLFLAVVTISIIVLLIKRKRFARSEIINNRYNCNLLDYLIIAAIILLAIGHLIQAASPSIKWDAATHHYLMPKLWIEAGRIIPIPETVFAEYPSAIEMLYMMGLQFGGVWLANIIGWALSLLLGLAIYLFTSERFNLRIGLVATLIFFSMPLALELVTGGLIDIGYSLFVFMSFWMFIEYLENGNRKNLFLSCVFAGFALGSKHLGVEYIVTLIFAYLIFIIVKKRFSFSKWITDVAILALIAFLLGLPWYIKSYVFTGNPVYPFLPGIFGGYEIREPISVHAWSRPDYQRSLITFFTYPWKLTTDFSFLDFWIMAINPIFLGTVPLWIIYRKRFPSVIFSFSIVFIIIFTLIAYRIAPSATRYMLPLFCVLSTVSAASMIYLSEDLRRFGKTILVIALIIPFMFNLLVEVKRVRDVIPWYTGKETADDVYRADFEGYDSIMFINEKLPEDAVVLTTDPKGYFFKRKFIIGTPGAQSQLLPPWSEKDSMKVLEGWRNLGITHILFNLSRNVMKNSYFVYTVTKGIEERGELIMTADELAELTKYETEYTYMPEEIAEFGRITQTPTIIKDGKTYYHLYREWWEKTVKQDKSQFMLRHYLNLKPYLKEIARFKSAVVYEIEYP